MNTEKFTQGEWHIWEDSLGFPFIFDEDGKAIASMCGKVKNVKKPICHIEDFVFPERVLANASLIAAAPEMYDCLKKTESDLLTIFNPNISQQAKGRLVEIIIENINSVLKKARGEE